MRYRFGSFEFDPSTARVTGPQGDLALRPMTLRVLQQLIENAPQLLTHEQLLDRVWGRQAVSPGVVSQSIRELRSALGDSAQAPRFIETRHRLGYCFLAEVSCIAASAEPSVAAAPPLPDISPTTPQTQPQRAMRRHAVGVALATIFLLLIAIPLWSLREREREGAATADTTLDGTDLVRAGHPREPQARAWFVQGLRHLGEHDFLQAQQQFEQALRREPEAVAVRVALADALAQAGELTRARAAMHGVAEAAGALPRATQLRIEAFAADLDHRRADAIAAWQAVFRLDPGDADAGLRLAAAQLGAGRGDEAEATLARVAALDPALQLPQRIAMARVMLAQARGDHAAALQAAQQAEAAASAPAARIDALLARAAAQVALGQPVAAQATLAEIDEALAQHPWPDAALRREQVLAALHRDTQGLPAAIARYEAVAHSATALGNRAAATAALREAAYLLFQAGRHDEALQRLVALENEVASFGDPRALAAVLDLQQLAQQRAGRHDLALALAQRALAAYVQAQDAAGEAAVRSNLGMLYGRDGRAAEAQQEMERALQLFRRIGDRRGIGTVQGNLAIVHAHAGRLDAARQANEEALAEFRSLGANQELARLQFNLAIQDRRAGRLADAHARFAEALTAFTALRAEDFRLQTLASLAELESLRAEPRAAQARLAGIDVDASMSPQRRAAIETARARAAALTGDIEAAEAGFRAAHAAREQAQLPDWVRMSELDLIELRARAGHYGDAEQQLRALRRDMLDAGDAQAAMQAGVLLAAVLHARGDADGVARQLDALEPELVAHPDAVQALRLDLVRAAAQSQQRDAALARVAQRAEAIGFDLLALRTRLLHDDARNADARAELERRGIVEHGMPPALPY